MPIALVRIMVKEKGDCVVLSWTDQNFQMKVLSQSCIYQVFSVLDSESIFLQLNSLKLLLNLTGSEFEMLRVISLHHT